MKALQVKIFQSQDIESLEAQLNCWLLAHPCLEYQLQVSTATDYYYTCGVKMPTPSYLIIIQYHKEIK